MTLPDDPTVDDLANEFEEIWEAVESDDGDDVPDIDFEPDELIDTAESRAQETARDSALEGIEHLIDEDCDNERCNELRDALGVGTHDHDHDDGDGDDDAGEAESAESVDDDGSDSGGADAGADGGGDDDDSGGESSESDVAWDEDTNIFGEKI